jgi:hypothetical protein
MQVRTVKTSARASRSAKCCGILRQQWGSAYAAGRVRYCETLVASCRARRVCGDTRTDRDAGYGQSIIRVNSDDNWVPMSAMLGVAKLG